MLEISSNISPYDDLVVYCDADFNVAQFKRVWIIDGDDTLWEDNLYYEELAEEFATYILSHLQSAELTREEIRALLDQIEHETIPVHGFGVLGFKISLEEAYRRILEKFGDIPEPGSIFEKTIPFLSGVPYEVDEATVATLCSLRERGDGLVLFTQGPREVQEGKIVRSGLAPSFHAVAVSNDKAVTTYERLIDLLGVQRAVLTVVGNSIRSEIVPAIELGIEAVLFENPNTWHSMNNSSCPDREFHRVKELRELLAL